jgi:hypothetical protein
MPEVGKVTTITTGYGGAPGYTSWYFFGDPYSSSTAQDNVEDAAAFWDAFGASMPTTWHFSVQPDVDVLDESTGILIRTESTTPPAQSVFGGFGEYAAGVGAVTRWNTAGVHLGQHLRGRTFIVPINSSNYEGDGTIKSGPLGQFRTAATNLAAVANFGVWGRPVAGAGGLWAGCTGGTVRDHVAWLSSRRD